MTLLDREAALALHYVAYNFCRVHQALGTTPAVAPDIALHDIAVEDVVVWLRSLRRADAPAP